MPAPIMNAGFYLRNPQGKRRKVYDSEGSPKWERLPSSAGRRRDRAVLRDDGHIVFQTLTSHSANLDLESSQATFYKKKAARLNWIPTSQCPVVLAMGGQIDPKGLSASLQKDLEAGKGCQPDKCSEREPCKHIVIEAKARQERRRSEEEKRSNSHESAQDKALKAQYQTQADISDAMNRFTDAISTKTKEKTK